MWQRGVGRSRESITIGGELDHPREPDPALIVANISRRDGDLFAHSYERLHWLTIARIARIRELWREQMGSVF